MHKCFYTGRIRLLGGKLWNIVTAHYKENSLDVFKHCEDGRQRSRNLYFRIIYGYGVNFPGDVENYGYGYGRGTAVLEPWDGCIMNVNPHIFEGYGNATIDETDKAQVLKAYPEMKWILQKHPDITRAETMELIPLWKKDHKVELLLDAGFKCMAFNKSFYKLTEKRRRDVLNFLKNNPGRNWGLAEVQTIMAEKISLEEYYRYAVFCSVAGKRVSYKVYKYLEHSPSGHNDVYLYHDYARMAKRCGHDMKDPYWAYPKNLMDAHDKVMKEMDRVLELEAKDMSERKAAAYLKAVKKWIGKKLDVDGTRVYIPESLEDIQAQAKALNQCLVTCDYAQRVINRKCVLVFIVKGNKRLATAELLPSGKIGQFYGNERHVDCRPCKTAVEALNQWKETYIKKVA